MKLDILDLIMSNLTGVNYHKYHLAAESSVHNPAPFDIDRIIQNFAGNIQEEELMA